MKYQNLLPDKQVGNYVWNHQALLGSGAFGKVNQMFLFLLLKVYLARDIRTSEFVALKIIENKLLQDIYMQNSLKNEVKILGMLKGQNVVGLKDFLQSVNRTYIIQMFCNQGDFRSYITKKQKIKESDAKKILQDILTGMLELVNNNLVHRDLKPENILIHDNVFKIADFGFGKELYDKIDNAMLKTCCGTPLYMSPQILMAQQYTAKSDIWSIGVIYYEMLFGRTPWPCRTQIELLNNIKAMGVKFPYGEQISEESKHFIKNCLKFEENQRYSWSQVFQDPLLLKKKKQLLYKKERKVDKHEQKILQRIQQIIHKKDNLKGMFILFDTTHTGSLNLNEFIKFVQVLDNTIKIEEIQKIFQKLDVDNDRTLNLQEFIELIAETDYSNSHENEMLNEYRANKIFKKLVEIIYENQIDIKQLIRKFDTSGDNQLDLQEFSQILKLIDDSITDPEIKFIFKKFDQDSSGKLTINEFYKAIKDRLQQNNLQQVQEKYNYSSIKNLPENIQKIVKNLKKVIHKNQLNVQMIFQNFDKNMSGSLYFLEFVSLIKTMNQRTNENDIQILFSTIDSDHNGTLSLAELQKILN